MQQQQYDIYVKYLESVSKYIKMYDSARSDSIYLGGSGYGFVMGYSGDLPKDLDLQYTNGFGEKYSLSKVDQLKYGTSINIQLPTKQIASAIKLAHPVDQFTQIFICQVCIENKYEKWINWFLTKLSSEDQQAILARLPDDNANKIYILEKMGDQNG